MPIEFLTFDDALAIHHDQVTRYGGATELRDAGLLESALAQPRAGFGDEYAHAFPHGMAAAYLFHIVSNHPFADGNKRVGAVCALVFLILNRRRFDAEPGEVFDITIGVADGSRSKTDVESFFRDRVS
ncbi:MAG: type II toxin-antitoxin system death-on-curing family toxin [Planctomycetota bacterium]